MSRHELPLGPVIIDIAGKTLQPEEVELLLHPLAGGVILFSRNYETPEQLISLIGQIRALRQPRLLLTIDQEGGGVQRLHEGFTQLPACRLLGRCYDQNQQTACQLASLTGWLMAIEMGAVGIDLSFAPVLDIDYQRSQVIAQRAFHYSPEVVSELAGAYLSGMQRAGMKGVGKHFPGHGWASADSHYAMPVDARMFVDLEKKDLLPYQRLIPMGLAGVMSAHIHYPKIDDYLVSFSRKWLKVILRDKLGFSGVIISDDISMTGAHIAGGYLDRFQAACHAGCDVVLVCNAPDGVAEIFDTYSNVPEFGVGTSLMTLYGSYKLTYSRLFEDPNWQHAVAQIQNLIETM